MALGHKLLNPNLFLYLDHGLKFDGVGCKFAYAIREFLHCHAIFVVQPAESLLIHVRLLQIALLG